ncbi:MAG: glycosyltransferase family 2 protein [Gammaproteobacteria bacterium]|nr:glycosyltransferase family 2 protein [Gammaproteobacteria bacterium]
MPNTLQNKAEMPLSVIIICLNEEASIKDCLESVKWVDEIIVVDSGSTDRTLEIARQYTDKVFVEIDWQGYGIQKQRAQDKATGRWILSIDADERVSTELRIEIESVIQGDANAAYSMPILPFCFGRFIRHGGWYPAPKVRLYPRDKAHYGSQQVHEKLEYKYEIPVKQLTGDLLHYTYRDLEHYLVKSAHYAAVWASQRQVKGKKASLSQGAIHALTCFLRMYILRAGFLDGKQGFLLAALSSHSTFVKYADLWTRQQS